MNDLDGKFRADDKTPVQKVGLLHYLSVSVQIVHRRGQELVVVAENWPLRPETSAEPGCYSLSPESLSPPSKKLLPRTSGG